MKRVNLGMSGGVDSSVSAHLLQKQGFEVNGVSFELCGDTRSLLSNASSSAERMGISWQSVNLKEQFRSIVISNFVQSYACGHTPNPCVQCNKEIKFRYLDFDCDYIATGHYAKVEYDDAKARYILRKADDLAKDQSYFLYGLSQDTLSKVIFPLGSYSKPEIRQIADELGLPNAKAKDSQDVCFIPDGDYASFIKDFLSDAGSVSDTRQAGDTGRAGDTGNAGTTGRAGDTGDAENAGATVTPSDIEKVGNFEDMDGNILGQHKGIIHYTIGQRKGLGLSLKKPMYVYALDLERNAVILGDNEDLYRSELEACDFNWISIDKPAEPLRCRARIRYRHREAPCVVETRGDRVVIKFDQPQRAITSGQSVVLYDDDIVIGGGIICG